MSVVERQADTVQPEAFEELGILLLEEILQKLGGQTLSAKQREADSGDCVHIPCRKRMWIFRVRPRLREQRGSGIHILGIRI